MMSNVRIRLPSRRMTSTAVVGSFTAGLRARSPMSTSCRMEKSTSWRVVRISDTPIDSARPFLLAAEGRGHTVNRGSPVWM